MTTRRFRFPGPLPPRGLIGLFGLPFGIRSSIVEPRELGVDVDGRAQRAVEGPMSLCTLEAGETAAGVDAAAGARPGNKGASRRVETLQLPLRRLAAAA